MPLIGTKEMLLDAQRGGYAVGAFNIENMEMAQAVVAAAEELHTPVILQTTPGTVRYGSLRLYAAMVSALASASPVPIALHLDHGSSFELAVAAMFAGYTSVMIDGSASSFEDNVRLTRRVVSVARTSSIPVEAELGKIGGKEDDLEQGAACTDPGQAAEFVRRTGVDSLAVAIGTAHGPYLEAPVLRVDRLREIRAAVDVPLVLHGSSGLSHGEIRSCVEAGVCKVNFATELRMAYSEGVKKALAERPDCWDPKEYGRMGSQYVKNIALGRMKMLFGKL